MGNSVKLWVKYPTEVTDSSVLFELVMILAGKKRKLNIYFSARIVTFDFSEEGKHDWERVKRQLALFFGENLNKVKLLMLSYAEDGAINVEWTSISSSGNECMEMRGSFFDLLEFALPKN